jgi:hypothetical protein
MSDWCACAVCHFDLSVGEWHCSLYVEQGLESPTSSSGRWLACPFSPSHHLALRCRTHVAGVSSYLQTFHVEY